MTADPDIVSPSLPISDTSRLSSRSRHRTTPDEHRQLAAAFPQYDPERPGSDQREKVIAQLLKELDSSKWTRRSIMQWMRNERQKLDNENPDSVLNRNRSIHQGEFTAVSRDTQNRLSQFETKMANVVHQVDGLETVFGQQINAMDNNLHGALKTKKDEMADIKAQLAGLQGAMADFKGHLCQELINLRQRVQPRPTLAQATRYTALMVETARSPRGGVPTAPLPLPRVPNSPVSRHNTPCSTPAVLEEQGPSARS
jgi:hypothetical protein